MRLWHGGKKKPTIHIAIAVDDNVGSVCAHGDTWERGCVAMPSKRYTAAVVFKFRGCVKDFARADNHGVASDNLAPERRPHARGQLHRD